VLASGPSQPASQKAGQVRAARAAPKSVTEQPHERAQSTAGQSPPFWQLTLAAHWPAPQTIDGRPKHPEEQSMSQRPASQAIGVDPRQPLINWLHCTAQLAPPHAIGPRHASWVQRMRQDCARLQSTAPRQLGMPVQRTEHAPDPHTTSPEHFEHVRSQSVAREQSIPPGELLSTVHGMPEGQTQPASGHPFM
jgi:hypothetical protein